MRYLLDTHVLIWWIEGNPKLSREQKRLLSRPPSEPFLVSDVTLWEVAMLAELGRIRIRMPLRDWLEKATAAPLVERARITPAIAAEVGALPSTFHRDPVDRVLVSTSRVLGVTLVTCDQRIIEAGLCPVLN